jgi:glutathione S-transferase
VKPILYTFRRCPYAIRARLAIAVSGVEVEMREVDLRDKPRAMLDCSPKGTVPVLQLADGSVIDESLDIMRWALAINDPEAWVSRDAAWIEDVLSLIEKNDGPFKRNLDRYKYPGRYPALSGAAENAQTESPHYHREQAEIFLRELAQRLNAHAYLMGERPSLPDFAIVPFVRQFARVDKAWFASAHQGALSRWLDGLTNDSLFTKVMQKLRIWCVNGGNFK